MRGSGGSWESAFDKAAADYSCLEQKSNLSGLAEGNDEIFLFDSCDFFAVVASCGIRENLEYE
jgi:hypothetical protein